MKNKKPFNENAHKAIELLGGATKATKKIAVEVKKINKHLNIKRSTIQKWKNNGVPAKWVPIIMKLTGLSGGDINPDIYPR